MLRLERVFPLQLLETLTLALESWQRHECGATAQAAIPEIFPPLRQHERVNLERSRHGLHLQPRLLAQSYRRDFELRTVPLNLPGPDRGIDTSRLLGKSVYKTESTSAASYNSSLGGRGRDHVRALWRR